MRRLNNGGDTIVEVLMAVIVLSLVMVTAYGVATRSLKDNQQSQEHTRALKFAESQIEQLKAYGDAGLHLSDSQKAGGFCFYSPSSGDTPSIQSFGAGEPTISRPDKLNSTTYPANCTKDLAPGGCAADNGLCYYYGFRQSNNVYTVNVRWAGINGGQDQVGLVYRINL